jgi:hypothetical protein
MPPSGYEGSDPDLGHRFPRMIIYNSEIHFLFNKGYKVFLAKVEPDGEIRWKTVASKPGPPRVANVYLCPGWKEHEHNRGRFDVICSDQDEQEGLVVINSWSDDGWDETAKVENEKCEQCEKIWK